MTLLYVMRAANSQELSNYLKNSLGWSGQKSIDLKNLMRFQGSIQRDLKMYIYEAVINKTFTMASLVSRADKDFVTRMLNSDDEFAKCLRRQCRSYKQAGYKPQHLEDLTSGIKQVCEELQTYCKMFIRRKLDFLIKPQALEVDDLVQSLLAYGIYAIYKAYPEIESHLHMTNIAKTAIANRGKNIIDEATTQSRSRLYKEKDGTFSSRLVSIHSSDVVQELSFTNLSGPCGVMVCNGMVTGLRGQAVEYEMASDVERKSDFQNSVSQLLDELDKANRTKAKRFLQLLMGHSCEEFSQWLGVKDNEDYSDTVERKVYVEQAREFLGIPVEKASLFVKVLQSKFSDFRNV